jgi:glutamate racemase
VIGVFDSGVGGLSVWREIADLMPNEPIIYLADQANVPYGPRSLDEVRTLTTRCIHWLISQGCSMVVIACNTASAAALNHARRLYPNTPIVGMEPAVKPAATHTQTGIIGVLATQATFQGELFASVVMRFAAHVKVIEQPCPGWVKLVEGAADEEDRLAHCQPLVDHYVIPLLDAGADSLVLGCTHFPFLAPAIQCCVDQWAGQHQVDYAIRLIDPSAAVARQTMRVRDQYQLSRAGAGALRRFYTTGDAATFTSLARRLLPASPDLRAAHLPCPEIDP